jgi:hypothetical protein
MKPFLAFVWAAAMLGGGAASALPNPLPPPEPVASSATSAPAATLAQATSAPPAAEPSPGASPSAATVPEAAPPAAPAGGGPVIDLPPDEPPKPASATPLPPPAVPRGVDPTVVSGQSYATDLGAGRRIPIGAYGEAMLLATKNETQLTLRRLVLFFGYHFADWVSVYSELEVENAREFEIEQSYLELKPLPARMRRLLGVRVGLVLLPLGIINQYHEPPTFNGVDRPQVDQLIIPTTWRELGLGIFGTPVDGLHYQLYAVAGADGSRFSADLGISPGLSRGFTTNTQNAAVTGRVNFNRVLGLDVGLGFYYGTANQKDANLFGVKVGLVEADARFTRWGLQLRAEYARVFVGGADKVTLFLRQTAASAAAIGSQEQGFYAEAGYNVLYPVRRTEQQVVLFARYENVDTRASLPDVPDPVVSTALQFLTAGVTYRPLLQLAIKFDYRRTLAGDDKTGGRDRYSLGVGFMY